MKRRQRLGTDMYVCLFCGYIDPVALIRVTEEWLRQQGVPSSLFEDHHAVGEKHDPHTTILLCRNCHANATEGLLRAGVSMRPEPDPVDRVAMMLDGWAVFHEDEATAERRMAELLRSRSRENRYE